MTNFFKKANVFWNEPTPELQLINEVKLIETQLTRFAFQSIPFIILSQIISCGIPNMRDSVSLGYPSTKKRVENMT